PVYDNMVFGLRMRCVARSLIDRMVHRGTQTLGIEELLDRRPRALSGGQRQRVALGRAIVREPQVFLMDEPLSNLDAKLRVQKRAELIKLHQRLQTTTIYVTHDQVEAMTMGSRIAVLRDGILQQLGAPRRSMTTRQQVRGRLHRQPGDELFQRAADRGRRSALCRYRILPRPRLPASRPVPQGT
ncbi:MAG: ABC transporter ATP-binding protein, partial [Chloroflexia bacterium]